MDNQLQSISKIFTEKLFRIPDYQRGYAWSKKQLKDFWSDIIQLEEGKNHYVGVLTLEKVPKNIYQNWADDIWIIESKNFEPFYVVDGQQRLTTTIMLIQALTEVITNSELLNYTGIDEIKKRYLFDSKDGGISRSYIFGYEKDNPSYEFLKTKIFNEVSTSGYSKEITIYTHNLESAKDFFVEKLKELTFEKKETIFKKVTQNLLFNIYAITSDIDVFIAFETMNNRGKPLSNLELLKNRLIYLSTKVKADNNERLKLRKIVNDGWKGIYHYLGKNKDNPLKDDFFLSRHCSFYFGSDLFSKEEIDADHISRRVIMQIENAGDFLLDTKFNLKNLVKIDGDEIEPQLKISDIKHYVESLQQSVVIWFNIYNPELSVDFEDEEKMLLERLNRIGIHNLSSLILAMYLLKPKEDQRLIFLRTLEEYSFLILLTKYGYFMWPDFLSMSIKLHNKKVTLLEVIKNLQARIGDIKNTPDFAERLIDKFKSDGFYQWQGIRYFLFEYELSLKEKSKTQKSKINWREFSKQKDDFITVEHIYPQTPKEECWKSLYNSYGIKQRRNLNNSLGNLLPLSKPKNSALQNKCFANKVENATNYVGFKYGSYSENEISGLTNWTPEDILARGLKLLKFMEERWNINFKSEQNRIAILGLDFIKTK